MAAGDPKASGNLLLLHHRGSGLQHSQLLPAGATLTPPPCGMLRSYWSLMTSSGFLDCDWLIKWSNVSHWIKDSETTPPPTPKRRNAPRM